MSEPAGTAVVRLLLADDHPVVRAGLRAVLETESDLLVCAEAESGEEAVARAVDTAIDVVLMDLEFSTGSDSANRLDGIDATRQIAAHPGAPHVVVLTTYDTDADILAAIEAGAVGYLLKDTPPGDLIAAVRRAAQGRSALAPPVADRLVQQMRRPTATALTTREREVLTLVAEGESNARIGQRLFLSQATVKTHLVHIYTKLGVGSRTAAVSAAQEQGILRRRS